MNTPAPTRRNRLKRFLSSWQAPAALGGVLLLGLLVFLIPRRIDQIVPVNDPAAEATGWDTDQAPPRRQIVWDEAAEPPGFDALTEDNSDLVTPRLADHGGTLYFARRDNDRQSDLFVTRNRDGRWTAPEPVVGVNSGHDELGPLLTDHGQALYFYSNRPGGQGGYDLYVAHRTSEGWSEPRNLGPRINTPAHEYDPAVSADGETLLFASNRTPDMSDAAVKQAESPSAGESAEPSPAWSTTLRATPGRTTFDLYLSRRDGPQAEWSAATAIEALNEPDTNEGAPFLSPDGAFLYFASDRAFRAGEAANLDLYRARLTQEGFKAPENLGPTINTAAHETEPALSPEGYRLVFSSDRTGTDRLYASQAREVIHDARWEAAELPAIPAIWWWSLLLTMLLLAVLTAMFLYHGWIVEKVWPARFFLGGVLLNLLLLMLLVLWKLPGVVDYFVQRDGPAEVSTELVDQKQHQSHEDGREAYEKVHDLQAVKPTDVNPVERTETEPVSVPRRTDDPLPTIPPHVARALPPERVLFVPKPQPETVQLKPLTRRAAPLPNRVRELAEEPVEVAAASTPVPAETPVRQNVQLARQETPTGFTPPRQLAPPVESQPAMQPASRPVARPDRSELPRAVAPAVTPAELTAPSEPRTPEVRMLAEADLPTPQEAPSAPATESISPAEVGVARKANTVRPAASLPSPDASDSPLPRTVAMASPIRNAAALDQSAESLQENVQQSRPDPLIRQKGQPAESGVAALTDDTAPELTPDDSPQALPIAQADLPLNREAPAVPAVGAVSSPFPGTQVSSGPTNPVPAAAARPKETPPLGRTVDLTSNPLTKASGSQPPQVAGLQEDLPEPAILTTAAAAGEQQPEPVELAMARITNLETGPTSAITLNQSEEDSLRHILPRAVAGRRLVQPDDDQGASSPAKAAPLGRAARDPRQSLVTEVAEAEDVDLSTTENPELAALEETQINLPRRESPPEDLAGGLPQELTGPAVRHNHRIVIGAPDETRNEAAPSLGPLTTRLSRRRAKATRVAMASDNVGLEALFTLRQGDTRMKYIELLGGSDESEKAVKRGLAWLAAQQNFDGSWSLNGVRVDESGKRRTYPDVGSSDSDTAGTGLALLPFLAAGNTHQSGKYQKNVAAGLEWLISHQKDDGDLFVPGNSHHWMYSHGIAAIALCEAYGMTKDEAYRDPAVRALRFIEQAQDKQRGGWRYQPGKDSDTSVVGWQMMALKSGEMAGLPPSRQTLEGVRRWLKHVEGNQPVGGTFGYSSKGGSPAMTAEGLLCLQFLGTDRNDPRLRAGADYLLRYLPREDQRITSYAWYYGTQVMYHMQGDYWDQWNETIQKLLTETQEKSGPLAGTWKPRDKWETSGGRLYATAMKVLMLEVFYRHLPLYDHLGD